MPRNARAPQEAVVNMVRYLARCDSSLTLLDTQLPAVQHHVDVAADALVVARDAERAEELEESNSVDSFDADADQIASDRIERVRGRTDRAREELCQACVALLRHERRIRSTRREAELLVRRLRVQVTLRQQERQAAASAALVEQWREQNRELERQRREAARAAAGATSPVWRPW